MFAIGRYLRTLLQVVVVAALLTGCEKGASEPEVNEHGVVPEASSKEYAEQVKELYERAKAAGEQVPADVAEWAKNDAKKIGSWDYKIVTISSQSEKKIVEELNTLGDDRWECYWVEPVPGGKRFYFKKSVRSYLQMAGKVSAFIPIPGGEE